MRHFVGLLLGIILFPAAFFALNWLVIYTSAAAGDTPGRQSLLELLGSYAAFGVVLGICLAWRAISPTALLFGGLLIIAAEVLLAWPTFFGSALAIPQLYDHPNITGTWLPLVAGVALLFGAFVPSRWHRTHPRDEWEDEMDVRGRDLFADQPERPYGRSGPGPDAERTAVQTPSTPRNGDDLAPAYDYQNQYDRQGAESTRRVD